MSSFVFSSSLRRAFANHVSYPFTPLTTHSVFVTVGCLFCISHSWTLTLVLDLRMGVLQSLFSGHSCSSITIGSLYLSRLSRLLQTNRIHFFFLSCSFSFCFFLAYFLFQFLFYCTIFNFKDAGRLQ